MISDVGILEFTVSQFTCAEGFWAGKEEETQDKWAEQKWPGLVIKTHLSLCSNDRASVLSVTLNWHSTSTSIDYCMTHAFPFAIQFNVLLYVSRVYFILALTCQYCTSTNTSSLSNKATPPLVSWNDCLHMLNHFTWCLLHDSAAFVLPVKLMTLGSSVLPTGSEY